MHETVNLQWVNTLNLKDKTLVELQKDQYVQHNHVGSHHNRKWVMEKWTVLYVDKDDIDGDCQTCNPCYSAHQVLWHGLHRFNVEQYK